MFIEGVRLSVWLGLQGPNGEELRRWPYHWWQGKWTGRALRTAVALLGSIVTVTLATIVTILFSRWL